MSLVKAKNAVIRAIQNALPEMVGQPVRVTGKLDQGRLSIYLGPIGRPVYKPEHYKFDRYADRVSCSFTFMLGTPPETDEALAIKTKCRDIGAAKLTELGLSGRPYVTFDEDADEDHRAALRDAWIAANPVRKPTPQVPPLPGMTPLGVAAAE